MIKLLEIKKPFILMVEGKDDAEMLYSLTEHMGLSKESFQVLQYKGKDKFPSFFKQVTNLPEFEIVTKLAIFRDADNSSQTAFQSIGHHLKGNAFISQDAIPTVQGEIVHSSGVTVGVFITPDCSNEGALESLLLSSLNDEMRTEINRYIEDSRECLGTKRAREKFKDSTKSRVYAYSALFENASFHDTFNKRLWNWDHPTFDKLKTFLKAFENE